ncbi:MAG: hypothetical protein ACRDID_09940, partial [Ktedonobacterales bacterium]
RKETLHDWFTTCADVRWLLGRVAGRDWRALAGRLRWVLERVDLRSPQISRLLGAQLQVLSNRADMIGAEFRGAGASAPAIDLAGGAADSRGKVL